MAEVTTVIRGEDKTAAAYRTAERRADAHARKLQGLSGAERKRYNAVGREYKKVQGEMKREDAARRASLQQTGLAFGAMAVVGVAALGKIASAGIAFNRQVETATIQFGSFFDSTEEAEAHVRSLTQFAASTPFQLPGILTASRSLKTFSADAVFGGETLRVIGDAAAGVSAPLEGVSLWVGRLYSGLKAGRPVGEAAARLQELGLLSGTARNKLEALAKEGGKTEEAMGVLRDEWAKHDGAMKTLSESTAGLESTFGDLTAQLAGVITKASGTQSAYKSLLAGTNAYMTSLIEVTSERGMSGLLRMLTGTTGAFEDLDEATGLYTTHLQGFTGPVIQDVTKDISSPEGGGGMAEAVKLLEINELLLFRAMDRTVDPAIRSHGGTIMAARLETVAWQQAIGGPGGLAETLGMGAGMVTGTVNPALGLLEAQTTGVDDATVDWNSSLKAAGELLAGMSGAGGWVGLFSTGLTGLMGLFGGEDGEGADGLIGAQQDWNQALNVGIGMLAGIAAGTTSAHDAAVGYITYLLDSAIPGLGTFLGMLERGPGRPMATEEEQLGGGAAGPGRRGDPAPDIPGARAFGGPVHAGNPYLVGERGPEMFIPSQSGSIVPNGAGGDVVVRTSIQLDGLTVAEVVERHRVQAQRRVGLPAFA